jgi:pyruvate/2-oxoglutarate dehydrogenase complex dihydrolipoamide dehydrogenase (E3) component
MCEDALWQKIMAIGGTPIGTAIPAELGNVVRLVARGDRLLAHTDSGVVVILYAPTGEGDLQ